MKGDLLVEIAVQAPPPHDREQPLPGRNEPFDRAFGSHIELSAISIRPFSTQHSAFSNSAIRHSAFSNSAIRYSAFSNSAIRHSAFEIRHSASVTPSASRA